MILPLTKNIYAYAQHILSNPTDAADITQEVMIKLWNTRSEPSPANHRHSAGKSTGGAHPAGNRRTGI